MSEKLKQAVEAIKAGDKNKGRQLLNEVLRENPDSEAAWLWMTRTTDSDKEKLDYFEKVLDINPLNEKAQQGIDVVQNRMARESAARSGRNSGLKSGFGFGIGLILAGVVVVVVLIGACCFLSIGLGSLGESVSVSRATSAPQSAPVSDSESGEQQTASGGLGQDIVVGEIRWRFLEAQDMGNTLESDNEFMEPLTTNGRFIRVRFEVENRSAEALIFSDINLVDSRGRSFEDSTDAAIRFVESTELCSLEQLNPNLTKTCTKIFEVPADAGGLKAQVGDLQPFTSDEALVDLGL